MRIAIDTETALITETDKAPPLVCLSMAGNNESLAVARVFVDALGDDARFTEPDAHGYWSAVVGAAHAADTMAWLLMELDADLVLQNTPYDMAVLQRHALPELFGVLFERMEAGRVSDTKVRELLLNIAKDKAFLKNSLGDMVQRYLGEDISESKHGEDAWRMRYSELSDVKVRAWPEAAYAYAAADAIYTLRVWYAQAHPQEWEEGVLVTPEGRVTNEVEQECADLGLYLSSVHGMLTDPVAVAALRASAEADVSKIRNLQTALGFLRVNKCKVCEGTGYVGEVPHLTPCATCGGDPNYLPPRARVPLGDPTKHIGRLRALVNYAYKGNPPMTDGDVPQVSTSEDTLLGSGHDGLLAYADVLGAEKILTTYVPLMERGELHPNPQVLLKTGRTSYRDPTLQNLPRKGGVRECVVARPGMVLVAIDFAAAELGSLAEVCLEFYGYSKLGEAINEGRDPHLVTASWFMGVAYDEAKRRLKEGDAVVAKHRQEAKALNFGLPGGLAVAGFVEYAKGYGLDLDFNKADILIDGWFKVYPEVAEYLAELREVTEGGGWGQSRDFVARQLHSNRLRGGCSYTSGANTYFQGLTADGAKAALWAITKEQYANVASPLWGTRIVNFVHDENLIEGPEATVDVWAREAARIMIEQMSRYTPRVRVSVDVSVMRRWYKGAKPTFNSAGQYVPWEPK